MRSGNEARVANSHLTAAVPGRKQVPLYSSWLGQGRVVMPRGRILRWVLAGRVLASRWLVLGRLHI